jgi:hypothetical protein
MTQLGEVDGWSLERQRAYLLVLARCQLPV